MTQFQIMLTILIPVAGWRLYSRSRKLIGRQVFHSRKLWGSVLMFASLVIFIGVHNLSNSAALNGLLGGCVAGLGLGYIGIRLTKFEYEESVLSYTPNAYLGLNLLLVLCGRLGYRFIQLSGAPSRPIQSMLAGMLESPFTTIVIGGLASYYTFYSAGVLYRSRGVRHGRFQ